MVAIVTFHTMQLLTTPGRMHSWCRAVVSYSLSIASFLNLAHRDHKVCKIFPTPQKGKYVLHTTSILFILRLCVVVLPVHVFAIVIL